MANIDVTKSVYTATLPGGTYTYNFRNAPAGATVAMQESIYLTNGGDTFYVNNSGGLSGQTLTVYGGAGNDYFREFNRDNYSTLIIYGGAGADTLVSSASLSGQTIGDTLVGGLGNDIYLLAAGNVADRAGRDKIIINAGDGNDTISGTIASTSDGVIPSNVIQINVKAEDLTYSSNGEDLIIHVGTTGQTVAIAGIANYMYLVPESFNLSTLNDATGTALRGYVAFNDDGARRLQNIIDGYINVGLTQNTLLDLANPSSATKVIAGDSNSDNNTLINKAPADGQSINLSGSIFSGFENITDNSGHKGNYLRGDSGNNLITVTGTTQGDQIWGGAGNDTLVGNRHGNTYWFGSGDGHDLVKNTYDSEVVYLYDGTAANVTYTRGGLSGTDLLITVNSTGATLTVENYFYSATATTGGLNAPKIKLADGTFAVPILTNPGGNNVISYDPKVATGLISASGSNNTVFADNDPQPITINLYDTTKFSGIQNIISNVRLTRGTYLRGDSQDNGIVSFGNADLWGGTGGNDTFTLINGNNKVWFGRGDGQDSLASFTRESGPNYANSSQVTDTINLYNVNQSEVQVSTKDGHLQLTFAGDKADALDLGALSSYAAFEAIDASGASNNSGPVFTTADGKQFHIICRDGSITTANYSSDNIYIDQDSATANVTGTAAATINLFDTTHFMGVNNATGGGNGYVRGNTAANTLTAAAGDQLWGAAGNDTLVGGGLANETVWFGTGDGQDVITGIAATDTVNLYNWNASDLQYAVDSNGYLTIIAKGNASDSLYIKDTNYSTLTFKDQNGQIFNIAAVNSVNSTAHAAGLRAGSIIISGQANGNDTVDGYDNALQLGKISLTGSGNIVSTVGTGATVSTTINLYDTTAFSGVQNAVGNGHDYLRGTSGDNVLKAGGANDQLWGAAGNDTLMGMNDGTPATAAGNSDTFWFGQNDGNDKVFFSGSTDSVMLYDSGLTASSVGVSFASGNLNLNVGGANLTLMNWNDTTSVNTFLIGGNAYKVQSTATSSGVTYSLAQK